MLPLLPAVHRPRCFRHTMTTFEMGNFARLHIYLSVPTTAPPIQGPDWWPLLKAANDVPTTIHQATTAKERHAKDLFACCELGCNSEYLLLFGLLPIERTVVLLVASTEDTLLLYWVRPEPPGTHAEFKTLKIPYSSRSERNPPPEPRECFRPLLCFNM